jgi:RecA/RadA recombinase
MTMPPLQRKSTKPAEETTAEETTAEETTAEEYIDAVNNKATDKVPIDVSMVVSTGCTLLDLAISGGRVRGGGLPGGIMVEIFGGSGSGKTAILTEIGTSVQNKGGEICICDPEARLDKEYARLYGLALDKSNYFRPNFVGDAKDAKGKVVELGLDGLIREWEPANPNVINMFGADSIAALSTYMEMEDGDKRGQRKAKELSEFCRKTARLIAEEHKLVVLTNQIRDGEFGAITPGGHAVPFHSSLRIQATQKKKIEMTKKNSGGKAIKKIIGIETELFIRKSSIDDPFRAVTMYLIFGMGIDDVRGNLQYLKDMEGLTTYDAITKSFVRLESAIFHIEDNSLEEELRDAVIEVWEKNEKLFKTDRKKKIRF